MRRDGQIKQEAYYYAVSRGHINPDYEEIEWGFQTGAEWADANPAVDWREKCCDVIRSTKMDDDLRSHLINSIMRL